MATSIHAVVHRSFLSVAPTRPVEGSRGRDGRYAMPRDRGALVKAASPLSATTSRRSEHAERRGRNASARGEVFA